MQSSLTQGYKHHQIRCNVDCLSTVTVVLSSVVSTVQQKHHRICLHIYIFSLCTPLPSYQESLSATHTGMIPPTKQQHQLRLHQHLSWQHVPCAGKHVFVQLITKNPEEGQSVLSGGPLRLSVSGQRVYFLKLQEDVASRKHHEQRCDWEKLHTCKHIRALVHSHAERFILDVVKSGL